MISFCLAASFGSILSGIFIDKIGRKSTALMNSMISLLGYAMLIFAEVQLVSYLPGCIISCVGVGMTSLVVPVKSCPYLPTKNQDWRRERCFTPAEAERFQKLGRGGEAFQFRPSFLHSFRNSRCAVLSSLTLEVYIAEVSTARLRSIVGAITYYAIVFGIFLFWLSVILTREPNVNNQLINRVIHPIICSFKDHYNLTNLNNQLQVCNIYNSKNQYNLTIHQFYAVVGFFLSLLSFLMIFMPETPWWLLAHNQKEKALKNLLWILGSNSDAEDTCNQIEINLAHRHIASVNDFRTPGLYRPLLIGILIIFIHKLSFIAYIGDVFDFFSNNSGSSNKMFKICFIVQFIFGLMGCFIVNRFSRRYLLLFGSGIFCLSSIGLLSHCLSSKHCSLQNIDQRYWLAYLIISATIFTFTWGPLPWIIVSEVIPSRACGLLGGIIKATTWLLTIFIQALYAGPASTDVVAYLCFSTVLFFLSILFVYYIVPETKNFTLEEIEHYYIINRGFRNYLL
ncbi:solute carrier family 2, facilitated glucose transporter member 8 isoform X2 [Hydra vulgaris]|uniref:solute carrier family 2, facilitated glucose transporter member 8 isoform X2 n=1 Tax=Hydra vulgaris TaxID=6087 RepID=UPI001F5FF1B4|nr:solute carrier family 2, facilitated glucose transporter member 8 isoform X2 [Hydra vulgaris]